MSIATNWPKRTKPVFCHGLNTNSAWCRGWNRNNLTTNTGRFTNKWTKTNLQYRYIQVVWKWTQQTLTCGFWLDAENETICHTSCNSETSPFSTGTRHTIIRSHEGHWQICSAWYIARIPLWHTTQNVHIQKILWFKSCTMRHLEWYVKINHSAPILVSGIGCEKNKKNQPPIQSGTDSHLIAVVVFTSLAACGSWLIREWNGRGFQW